MSMSEGLGNVGITCEVSDASAAEHLIVVGNTSNTTINKKVVAKATGSTVVPLGVTCEATTAANQNATIQVAGVAMVTVDGSGTAIDINDSIIPDSSARGVKAAAAGATEQIALGYALAPSSAAGDVIPVLIDRHHLEIGAS